MGVLSNLVIAITGTLPAEPSNIKKWVDANGGKYSPRLNKSVTHLVASKDAWRRVDDAILKAAELGCQIVSYDWLEDSLHKRRKLAEKKYTFEAIKEEKQRQRKLKKMGVKADSKSKCLVRKPKPSKSLFFATPYVSALDVLKKRRAEREAAEATEKAAKAAKAAKKAMSSGTAQAPIEVDDDTPALHAMGTMPTPPASVSPVKVASPSPSTTVATSSAANSPEAKIPGLKDLYHYYLDKTGFEYNILLVRNNFAKSQLTRYRLRIMESHATPHTYCTHVQYLPPPRGSVTSDTQDISDAKIRNPLLKFLNRSIPEPPKQSGPAHIPTMSHTPPNPAEADRLRALVAPRDEPPVDQSELARLHTLITPAIPSADLPHTTLVCPMTSTFATAWRAFRHVFRDLTLLSWEERFECDSVIQMSRAQTLNIEPYRYKKPEPGTPNGVSVQENGLYHGFVGDMFIAGDAEDGYVRNEFNLPGMDEELSEYGIIGSAIHRAEEEVRKKEEARLEKIEEKERKEREAMRTKRTAEHRKPFFNGVMGRPQEWEVAQARTGGYGGAARARQSKPWPSERLWG